MIVQVAVSAATFAIDKPYSYRVPEGMPIQPGQRVQLPFGRGNRPTEGVVLTVSPGDDGKLKEVTALLDPEPILTDRQLRLAAFLRERTQKGCRTLRLLPLAHPRARQVTLQEDAAMPGLSVPECMPELAEAGFRREGLNHTWFLRALSPSPTRNPPHRYRASCSHHVCASCLLPGSGCCRSPHGEWRNR